MELMKKPPTPGMLKIVSTTREPVRRLAASGPRKLTTGQDRDLQRVLVDDARFARALCARRADEILVQHLQHARAHEPRDVGDVRPGERDRGQDEAGPASQPPTGSQPSLSAKRSTSTGPMTKVGMLISTSAASIAPASIDV